MISLSDVCAVVLAGGRGTRMQANGCAPVDKGLTLLHGRPLIEWAVGALPHGLAHVYISANQHQEQYARYGHVLADDPCLPPQSGPLAGVATALSQIPTSWLAVVPADVPQPPCTLLQRLLQCVSAHASPLAYACAARPQPLFMLLHVSLLESIYEYLHSGERQVLQWQRRHGRTVYIPGGNDAFFNINTQEELCLAHQLISPHLP